MYRVMLVSHGELANAMLKTAELIVGEKKGVITYGLNLGDDVETFRKKVTETIAEILKKDDLLVLTDIQSGSPFNVAVGAMINYQFIHITGMNLPIVVEALSSMEDLSLDELVEDLFSIGKSSIINVNQFMEQNVNDELD